jgi:hypothetical protein
MASEEPLERSEESLGQARAAATEAKDVIAPSGGDEEDEGLSSTE